MEPLTPADIERLAQLQCECIPESLISQLGRGYARSFYRYVNRSPWEKVFLLREAGQIGSAAVLSLKPHTIRRRLLVRTPLVLFAGAWAMRRVFGRRKSAGAGEAAAEVAQDRNIPEDLPELLLLFTAPELRGSGLGAVLVSEIDRFLGESKIPEYLVRTQARPENRALKFYRACGFVPVGRTISHGEAFTVFKKLVGPGKER